MNKLACLMLTLVFASPLIADDNRPIPAGERKVAQSQKPKALNKPVTAAVDREVEADVLEFVREHHAELADLLQQLKENRPKEYQKAIRDLSRVRERLHTMQKNDSGRYDLELSVWKAETRIQLIAARLQMGDKSELRNELRAALNEQVDLRLALLKHEREMTKGRLEKLDAQIKKLDSERSQIIDRQLTSLTKSPGSEKPGKKPAEKTAEKPTKN